jgi:hypothetical protein
MAKSKTDLSRKIEGILQHTNPLPAESTRPILHFERTAASSIDLLKYVDDHLTAAGASGSLHGENMAHQDHPIGSRMDEDPGFLRS